MNENETRKTNYAAIDIGSNAVRLLIKEIKEEQGKAHFSKVLMLRVPLRLGFDVFDIGKISEKKEKNMIRLMKAFRHLMKIYDVKHCRACATSAMRDAKNGMDIIKQIEKKTGVHIDIIDGQEEAKIIYNNHVEHMEDQKGQLHVCGRRRRKYGNQPAVGRPAGLQPVVQHRYGTYAEQCREGQ